MKKTLMLLMAAMLVASSAFAILDSAPDNIGLYFDTNADVVCTTAAFIDHVPAYFILTNPTLPQIRGFEVGMNVVNRVNSSITITYPVSATDVGAAGTGGVDFNYIVGYATPMGTSAATILGTLDIFFLDTAQLDFILGPAAPSSDPTGEHPMVVKDDFSLMAIDTSNEPGMPAAQINAPQCMVVDNEDASFGAVKALFR